MKIEDVKRATDADDMMQSIITLCRNGRWFEIHKSGDPMMREFCNVREELTVTDDNTLLRGRNVVIPASLWNQVVALSHEGHQGIVKTRVLNVKGVVPENERHGGDGSTSMFRLPMQVQR